MVEKVSSLLFLQFLDHLFIFQGTEGGGDGVLILCLALMFRIFSVSSCVCVCMCVSPFGKTKDGFPCPPWKKCVTYNSIPSWEHGGPKSRQLDQRGEEVFSFPEGSMSHSVRHFGRPESELSRKSVLRQFNLTPSLSCLSPRHRCSNYFLSGTENNVTVEEVS